MAWALLLFAQPTLAIDEPPLPETFANHKVVLQISDANPGKHNLVLNVANNLLKHYGVGNIDIEIVAFGPGLRLMMDGHHQQSRVKALMDADIRFSACKNTLTKYTEKLGYQPKLTAGISKVPAGAARILQLNAAGYQILKP